MQAAGDLPTAGVVTIAAVGWCTGGLGAEPCHDERMADVERRPRAARWRPDGRASMRSGDLYARRKETEGGTLETGWPCQHAAVRACTHGAAQPE